MSEQDQSNDNSGIGISGLVGGAAAGSGAAYWADKAIAEKNIKAVLTGDAKASEGFKKSVTSLLNGNEDLRAAKLGSSRANMLSEYHATGKLPEGWKPAPVQSVEFVAEADKTISMKLHTKRTLEKGTPSIYKNVGAVPEGFKVGEVVTDKDTIAKLWQGEKSLVKELSAKGAATAEKTLIADIGKAGGLGFGFHNLSGKGKLGVVAGVIAVTAVGAKAAHAIFGGKNTNRVNMERAAATPDQATGRA